MWAALADLARLTHFISADFDGRMHVTVENVRDSHWGQCRFFSGRRGAGYLGR